MYSSLPPSLLHLLYAAAWIIANAWLRGLHPHTSCLLLGQKHKQLHLDSSSLSCQINSANVPDTQKTGFEGLQHTRRSFCWNCVLNGKFALEMSAKNGVRAICFKSR